MKNILFALALLISLSSFGQTPIANLNIIKTEDASINFDNINTIDYNDVKVFVSDNIDLSKKVINRVESNNFYLAFIPDALFYLKNDNNLINNGIIRYDNSPEGDFLIFVSKGNPYKYVKFFQENNSFKISQLMEKISENKWVQKEFYGRNGPLTEVGDGKLYEYEEYLVIKGDFVKSGLEIIYYPSGKIQQVESGLRNPNPSDNTNGLFSERYFYENGQLAMIKIYFNNKEIVRYWDENGEPLTK